MLLFDPGPNAENLQKAKWKISSGVETSKASCKYKSADRIHQDVAPNFHILVS